MMTSLSISVQIETFEYFAVILRQISRYNVRNGTTLNFS